MPIFNLLIAPGFSVTNNSSIFVQWRPKKSTQVATVYNALYGNKGYDLVDQSILQVAMFSYENIANSHVKLL